MQFHLGFTIEESNHEMGKGLNVFGTLNILHTHGNQFYMTYNPETLEVAAEIQMPYIHMPINSKTKNPLAFGRNSEDKLEGGNYWMTYFMN